MSNETVEMNQEAEAQLTDELLRNERIVTHPELGEIRLRRPTPREQRMIDEERRKQYHADYSDPTILSQHQMEEIALERGDWSPEDANRLEELWRRVAEIMGVLKALDYSGVTHLFEQYTEAVNKLYDLFKDDEEEEEEDSKEIADVIARFFNLDMQKRGADRAFLMKHATSTEETDLIQEAEYLRGQVELLNEMLEARKELNELQVRSARIFNQTVEARAEQAESMARMYHCAELVETGEPIWESIDVMWDADPEALTWLQAEMFYFLNGITDEMKEVLDIHGFTVRMVDTEDSSDDSQDHPMSNSDGESQEKQPKDSLEVTE